MATASHDATPEGILSETALDARAHLIRIQGGAAVLGHDLRWLAIAAIAAKRVAVIVDLSEAVDVDSAVAYELSRAHERLLWRGGYVVAVSDPRPLERLFAAFALHRAPDVVPTLDDALAAANVSAAGVAVAHETQAPLSPGSPPGPPGAAVVEGRPRTGLSAPGFGTGEGVEASRTDASTFPPPPFAWRRDELLPASWTFQLRGGRTAPSVARAAIGRVLTSRISGEAHRSAMLLVSEVVTNSVRHGGAGEDGSLDLTVTVEADVVHVEVADPVGGFEPPPPPEDPLALSGRGLPLVDSVSSAWGVNGPPGGAVWFELARGAA